MRRLVILAAVLAAAVATLGGPPPAQAGTVCKNVNRDYGAFSRKIRAGGEVVARLWIHSTKGFGSCTVLRAVKWRGTPHYMFLQVCTKQIAPRRGAGCSGYDAGAYRYYAGPVYHSHQWCTAVHVKVDVPGGRRVVDRFIHGPCD